MKTTEIMDVPFVNTDMGTLVHFLDERLSQSMKTFLATPNPEIMMYAEKDPSYLNILKEADLVIPDGIGIVVASRILGTPIEQRLAGFDLVLQLLELCSDKGYTLYFLGSGPSVVEQAVHQVKKMYPSLRITGYHHGYFDMADESVAQDIRTADPDVILAGLGFPKQEKWMARYRSSFHKGLLIGVGGSFDVLAGKTKRAPEIWRKLNIEWLYRLIKHPKRWRRMLALPLFISKVTKSRIIRKKM